MTTTELGATALPRRRLGFRVDDRAASFGIGLALAPVLASNGGYFPTSWGWSALAFAWAAAIVAAIGAPRRLSRAETVFVAALVALVVWCVVSILWTSAPTQGPLEIQRTLVYLAAAIAIVVIGSRTSYGFLIGGICTAIVLVAAYALATRLFPAPLGSDDPIAGHRLSRPIGYWNALGLVSSIGILLALQPAARSRIFTVRIAAAAASPILFATLYFTFSRGSWLALFAGLACIFALDPERLRFLARTAPVLAFGGLVVLAASHEHSLTHLDASQAAATAAGHRLAVIVLLCCVGAGLASEAAGVLQRRIQMPRIAARAISGAAVLCLVAVAAVAVAQFGSPVAMARHAYRSFAAPAAPTTTDLNGRLFTLSGTGRREWWATALHAFESRPLTGIGPGAWETYWLHHRTAGGQVRDAHSLVLETLAETGAVGFAILIAALAAPLTVVRRIRRMPLALGALAAYVAYLVDASVDWDWELAGVTLAGLACGAAVLLAARPESDEPAPRAPLIGLACLVALAALLGLVPNIALASSADAARTGAWLRAASQARRARTWEPWSAQPWRALGEAQLGLGRLPAARASFRTAIAKDPGDWNLWFDLARASSGDLRASAIARAARLNPHSPEIAQLRSELGGEPGISLTAGGGNG